MIVENLCDLCGNVFLTGLIPYGDLICPSCIVFTRQEISSTTGMPEGQKYEVHKLNTHNDPYWAIMPAEPFWNWYEFIYRPVAPDGYNHTGEFRMVKDMEFFLDWDDGCREAYNDHQHERHWILKSEIIEEKKEQDDDQIEYEIEAHISPNRRYKIKYLHMHSPFFVSELSGLVISGRIFRGYMFRNDPKLYFLFEECPGIPDFAIFRRIK